LTGPGQYWQQTQILRCSSESGLKQDRAGAATGHLLLASRASCSPGPGSVGRGNLIRSTDPPAPACVLLSTPAASRDKLKDARVAQKPKLETGPLPVAIPSDHASPQLQARADGQTDLWGWVSRPSSAQLTAAAAELSTHLPRERKCVCAV